MLNYQRVSKQFSNVRPGNVIGTHRIYFSAIDSTRWKSRGNGNTDTCLGDYIYNMIYIYTGWWFGTWILWLSIYWECHNPNWRAYFSEGLKPPTIYIYIYMCNLNGDIPFIIHIIYILFSLADKTYAISNKSMPSTCPKYVTNQQW